MVGAADRMPVLFLWHHHQPFYSGYGMERPTMPWVRLHAVRGYADMAAVAEETGAGVTFNFSPSLIEQLVWAAENRPCDEFERLSLIRPQDMSEEQRRFVLRHFFSVNRATQIEPSRRYLELLAKRGERPDELRLRQAIVEFSVQDYLDLIALFNLSWIGFAGRRKSPIVELLRKAGDFVEQDIEAILNVHRSIMRSVLPSYRRLYESGQVEISVSPYSHSILPLLCDTGVAAPDLTRQSLPKPEYRHPEDANRQLRMAVGLYQNTWGTAPAGLWPSEGSVSEEVLDLIVQHGFTWVATDQGVLARSEATRRNGGAHFFPYLRKREGGAVRVYFRDHALSDAIGFRYSAMAANTAVEEFIGHLIRIEETTRGLPGRCVVIALDGENPWESYRDSGESLLKGFYQVIGSHARLRLSTFKDHSQPGFRERIDRIHAGSWIDANFKIWIGDPEKNQAWIELERARQAVDGLPVGDDRRKEAFHWLDRALCSDWMWWYGEPFSSEYKPHFDELFRGFLRAVYAAVGRPHPVSLDTAIVIPRRTERRTQPLFPISPVLDGHETSFFEWAGSCRIDARQGGTTMGRSEPIIRSLWYGFGDTELFFRFDPALTVHPHSQAALNLHVLGSTRVVAVVPLSKPNRLAESPEDPRGSSEVPRTQDVTETQVAGDGVRWAAGDILEVAVRRESLGLIPGGECRFWVEVEEEGSIVETLPPQGAYHYVIPTEEAIAANWMV